MMEARDDHDRAVILRVSGGEGLRLDRLKALFDNFVEIERNLAPERFTESRRAHCKLAPKPRSSRLHAHPELG